MAYPLFGSPEPPHNSRWQNGPGFSANAVKHLVVTFLVSLLIFLGSFPTLDSLLHHAPDVVAEDFCQSVEFDTPATQNHQNLHDISCLDIFQPGLMQNLRTGFEKPLNLRAKTGLVVAQRAGIGTNLPHRRIAQIAFEMPPESDNSRVVDVLQWSDLFVSCMSSASAVEGQDAESSHFFSRQFQLVQYISGILVLVFCFMYFFHAGAGSCVMYFYIMHVPCCGHLGFKTCADIQASVAPTSTLTASKPASIVQTGAYEPHPSSVPNVSQTKKPSEPCNSRTTKAESEVEEASGGRQMATMVLSAGSQRASVNSGPQGV